MKIFLFILSVYLSMEILILIFFPKWLKINQFEDSKVITNDKDLGWKQRPNISFRYHHRYNKFITSNCKFNNFGILDNKNYFKKKKKKIRIALFGDSHFAGYDYGYKISIQNRLKTEIQKYNSNVELIFCFQRNYNTYQLFKFYKKFFNNFKIDHLIYIFNPNHPRRNITLHEARKSKKITYPYFNFNNLKIIKNFKIINENDFAYLNEKNKIVYKKFRNSTYFIISNFFYNYFYIYSFISDQLIGNNNLRNIDYINDINTIEKKNKINIKNYPYQWKVTKKILLEWKKYLHKKKTKFHIIKNLINYQYDINLTNHMLSFDKNKIPDEYYLNDISKKIGVNYLNKNKKYYKKGFYYIHPRYGYYNPFGITHYSKILLENILNIISK